MANDAEKKQIIRLRKLQELAEHGEAGERENARVLLDSLLKKYGISEEELSDDVLAEHSFKYKTVYEKRLLVHLIDMLAPDRDAYTISYMPGAKNKVFTQCTQAEAVQIAAEYEFYRDLWGKEMNMFFIAFVNKHNLFSRDQALTNKHSQSTLSEEDIFRIFQMMGGMEDKSFHPRLEAASDEEE